MPKLPILAAVAAFTLLCPAFTAPALAELSTASAHAEPRTDRWWGQIQTPGMPLRFAVRFTTPADAAGPVTGEIDIPAQGAQGLPLTDITLTDTAAAFTLKAGAANAVFQITLAPGDDATSKGTMKQGGMTFPVLIRRGNINEGELVGAVTAPRPQHPKPPFPYDTRDVTFTHPVDGITLAGTITTPRTPGPFAAVVLVSGSGPQDRDETIFDHKPFLVIADHLTRAGFAVLRYDDRGVGGSTGDHGIATSRTFATDARAALEYLKTQPNIRPDRVGIVGHSEGAMIAAMLAAQPAPPAFIVMLAGPGLPGRDLLLQQAEAMARSMSRPADTIAAASKVRAQLFDAVIAGKPEPELRELTIQLIRTEGSAATPEADLAASAGQQLAALTSPWFREFLVYDPATDLSKITIPVLALFGEKDRQVPPEGSVEALTAAFEAAGNSRAVIKVMPGLNHLFQTARTGAVVEYGMIPETFAPAALKEVEEFIRASSK